MKRLLLTAVLILSATVSASAEFDESEVRAMCANDWPDEQELQDICLIGEREGYGEVMVYYDAENPMDQISLRLCMDRWGLNWSFIATCFEEQTDAFADFPYLPGRYGGQVSGSVMQDISKGCSAKWRPDLARQHFCIVRMAQSILESD